MSDPITEMIFGAPSAAVIKTPADPDKPYDPGSEFDPGVPQDSPVTCFFSRQVQDGAAYTAVIIVRVQDYPSHVRPQETRVDVAGGDYLVVSVTVRRWLGQVNGYQLELVIG